MDNRTIADHFSLLAKLIEVHGENSFKAKSYSIAAYNIEKLPFPLSTADPADIFRIKGIGDAIGKKILQLVQTGDLPLLRNYLETTPEGVIEMLQIKGLGAKKINTIWKELQVEDLGELLYACNENRLLMYKGFGAKTQESIRDNINFYLSNKDNRLYAEVEVVAFEMENYFKRLFPQEQVSLTGEIRRQCEVITKIEILISTSIENILEKLESSFAVLDQQQDTILLSSPHHVKIQLVVCEKASFSWQLFQTTGSPLFLEAFLEQYQASDLLNASGEEEIFEKAGLEYIPPAYREKEAALAQAAQHQLPKLINVKDIKAIIHAHSNWSDGRNKLEEMAVGAKEHGFEYLVISDHSQSAFYAQGLQPEKIIAQQQQVNELNKELAPFKIFKSIESDILYDGRLDYTDEILKTFDLVIASVHSNLKMEKQKAMTRLLKAIENPYIRILGHMTGRLLLSRNGYPLDHKKIIDACAANKLVIELNAHPRRLDIDWRWLDYAMEREVMISIDPDAHSIEGFKDIQYGVIAARKGGLTAKNNLSSFSLSEFENFLHFFR